MLIALVAGFLIGSALSARLNFIVLVPVSFCGPGDLRRRRSRKG